jgi:hypothetical protein
MACRGGFGGFGGRCWSTGARRRRRRLRPRPPGCEVVGPGRRLRRVVSRRLRRHKGHQKQRTQRIIGPRSALCVLCFVSLSGSCTIMAPFLSANNWLLELPKRSWRLNRRRPTRPPWIDVARSGRCRTGGVPLTRGCGDLAAEFGGYRCLLATLTIGGGQLDRMR